MVTIPAIHLAPVGWIGIPSISLKGGMDMANRMISHNLIHI